MSKPTITPDPSCQDDYDSQSLSVSEARQRIIESVQIIKGNEKVALRSALGRILAEPIQSPVNVPQETNSAMDGYAIAGSDLPDEGEQRQLHFVGTAWAGRPFEATLNAGECVRIFTGAVMPAGADTVVMQERVASDGDTITIDSSTRSGDNVRAAGEDIRRGAEVLPAGTRLQPSELGLLASLGQAEIKVRRRLRVAFFSTGDELRSIGETLGPGMIYDSNRYTIHGMLTRLGCDIIDMGVVRDTPEATDEAFRTAADCADVLITSGGVSVGEADYVKDSLEKLGRVGFWKVAMKPGRPLAFGHIQDATFFGLPGNPVSVMVTFYQFVQPALRQMMGENVTEPVTVRAVCQSRLRKKAGRFEFQRGVLSQDDNGQLTVNRTGAQGSGILTSMSQANCFIMLPVEATTIQPGDTVEVQPFYGLI